LIGNNIHNFAKELWPINRSITGPGVRDTLKAISKILPKLKVHSVPSQTKVFDWVVPKEWNVNEAYIITPSGDKICDFSKNNLHLVGYSIPFKGKISFEELKKHLHTIPEQKKAIPYITSYYEEKWGFCLSHDQFEKLEHGTYSIVVDTNLFNGELNYGELLIKGNSDKEIFLSTCICHPSMANNELSGISVLTFLADWLQENNNNYSYRIVFVPETIGSITYLHYNLKEIKNKVFAGFNVVCVGDNRSYSYLPSRKGNTISDLVAKHILKYTDKNFKHFSWLERGSDERQYCSPEVDLPIASILRTKYGEYPEYHTSLDDLENVVTPEGLNGGYWAIRKAIEAIEKNKVYKSNFLCEPQMGKRGLYPQLSTKKSKNESALIMNIISFCDGDNSLLKIAETLDVPIWTLYEQIEILKNHNLISQL